MQYLRDTLIPIHLYHFPQCAGFGDGCSFSIWIGFISISNQQRILGTWMMSMFSCLFLYYQINQSFWTASSKYYSMYVRKHWLFPRSTDGILFWHTSSRCISWSLKVPNNSSINSNYYYTVLGLVGTIHWGDEKFDWIWDWLVLISKAITTFCYSSQ